MKELVPGIYKGAFLFEGNNRKWFGDIIENKNIQEFTVIFHENKAQNILQETFKGKFDPYSNQLVLRSNKAIIHMRDKKITYFGPDGTYEISYLPIDGDFDNTNRLHSR